MKYKIAAFYSFHKRQSLPSIPQQVLLVDKPGIILGGQAYRWFNILVNTGSKYIFESLITTILYSKKGMPRPDKELVRKSESEAFEKLTVEPSYPSSSLLAWGDIPEAMSSKVSIDLNRGHMLMQLDRTVKEILKDVVYTDEDRIRPFVPSTSANYNNTRTDGGALGDFMSDETFIKKIQKFSSKGLIDMKIVNPMSRHNKIVVDSTRLRSHFISFMSEVMDDAIEEEPLAVPLGLPEALKVRVISKGPHRLYTALKPLQRVLWGALMKHPASKLVGEPVTAEFIQERMGSKLGIGEKYLSVDYSDATNEMFSWVSEQIAESIGSCLQLSDVELQLFIRALTKHIMAHGRGSDRVFKPQKRGQLMGSIVSFPVLCIANLAICRWAMEIANKRVYTLADAPIAVNGDDGILKINNTGRLAWERIASFCGLQPSVGKVYYSDSFLNINSTTYNFHPLGWEGYTIVVRRKGSDVKVNRIRHFELVQYVNLGLLFNLQRSGLGSGMGKDQTLSDSVGARVRELIRLCPLGLREKVLAYFLNHNRGSIGNYSIPWFIPESLGGLGFPIIGRFTPRDKDLRLARKIYNYYDVPKPRPRVPWQIWKIANAKYRNLPMISVPTVEGLRLPVISRSNFLALACVEVMFTHTFEQVFLDKNLNKEKPTSYFKALEKLWQKAERDHHPFPEPFSVDNFPTNEGVEPTYSFYDYNEFNKSV